MVLYQARLIKCSELNCLKWRKVTQGEAANAGEDWVCSMSKDEGHASCDVPEEPYVYPASPPKEKPKKAVKRKSLSTEQTAEGDNIAGRFRWKGKRVKVFAEDDEQWFVGTVTRSHPLDDLYEVRYDDDNAFWEKQEDLVLLEDQTPPPSKKVSSPKRKRRASTGSVTRKSAKRLRTGSEGDGEDTLALATMTARLKSAEEIIKSLSGKLKYVVENLAPELLSQVSSAMEFDEVKFCGRMQNKIKIARDTSATRIVKEEEYSSSD